MARKKKIVENKTNISNEESSFSELLVKDNTIQEKNKETLEKMQKPAVKVYEEQEKKKKVSAQSVLDKYVHNEDEYQAHLKKLRETDFVMTTKSKLKNFKIPGHVTVWASTDPKASKSIQDFKNDGFYIVEDMELVETGSSSVQGAGFHIPMACPEDIAKKRELALKSVADEQYNRVLKKKIEHKGAKDSFLYEKNTLDEDFSF